MNVTAQIERIGAEIKTRVDQIRWLKAHRAKLERCGEKIQFVGTSLADFDNLSHAEVLKVVKAFGGKWKKTPADNASVHYESVLPGGMTLRCYQGQPPPSCKIVEVEEFVPEQVIPASVRKVKKMICHPEVGAVIASTAERGQAQASQNP